MITKIRLKNFKSFSNLELSISALTLLTGVNSSGKSSVLHALLALRQSSRLRRFFDEPPCIDWGNDDGRSYVRLGTLKDVFSDSGVLGTGVTIAVESDTDVMYFKTIEYNVESRDQKLTSGEWVFSNPNWNQMSLFSDNFQYLSSDRISPQEDYPRFSGSTELGFDGRFAPNFLEKFGETYISIQDLKHPRYNDFNTIHAQLNAWMGEISPGVEVKVKENSNTNRVELSYLFLGKDGIPTQNRRPQNVGFGITQTLPILVALLSSRPGDLLIFENPESHLHPRGQSCLGMLFAKAANAGVQIILESHSDHILNGIRVAVSQKNIMPEFVSLWFFERKEDQKINTIQLKLDANGRVDRWPIGFFDEWDNMLDKLLL